MKLVIVAILGTLTIASVAQTKPVVAKLPPPVQQTATGASSANVANVNGSVAVNPQVPSAAEPTVAELKRELAIEKVRTAIANAQAAEMGVATATENATAVAKRKEADALALIESTKKELGYDDRWDWNFQANGFVMKPLVGVPPAAPPKK